MTPQEEFRQGVKGLALHFCEAYAVVLTAYVLGFIIEWFARNWGWFVLGMGVFGILWETGSHLYTRYHAANHPLWKKSIFGMMAFWFGASIAAIVATIVGYYLGTPL